MSKNIFDYLNDTTPFALQKCEQFLAISPNELYAVERNTDETALIKAVSEGKSSFVKLFIDKNIHGTEFLNHKNSLGWSALHFAAHYGRVADIESLIATGADVHAKDNSELTPLCSAVIMGHLAVVDVLLKHGAIADYRSPIGSPTVLALGLKDEAKINSMLTLLLQYGGDPYDEGASDEYSQGPSVWGYLCDHDMINLIGNIDSD